MSYHKKHSHRNNQINHVKKTKQKKLQQQIYVVYHHYIYYTYISLYISLNIRKYLLLVHCTKMIFKQGTKNEACHGLKIERNVCQR